MANEIKVGSVVTLKSGSPKMTVDYIGDSRVTCVWFVDGVVSVGEFSLPTLKLEHN